MKLEYMLCHGSGCTAEVEATPELISDLKTFGGMAVFAINYSDGKPVAFPVPFAGFADALSGPPMDNQKYANARRELIDQIKQRQ